MTRVFGIDVSHYQGDVNWDKVAEGQTKFAIAKATEGSTLVDSSFARINSFGRVRPWSRTRRSSSGKLR